MVRSNSHKRNHTFVASTPLARSLADGPGDDRGHLEALN